MLGSTIAVTETDTMTPEPRDPRADSWVESLAPATPLPGNWPAPGSIPLSVLIPVKNEQSNLAECLRRLQWAAQITVIDSQSLDATVPIAQALGAEVYQFYYSKEGWPKKKNWALDHVPWRHEWLLILDADEHMTPDLAAEIVAVVSGGGPQEGAADGYYLNRRFMFMKRWIRHCGYYPSWNLRLFRHRLGRYERIGNLGNTGSGDNEVHEHVVLAGGTAAYLRHDFLHYAYPDLATWVEKHNRYSTWEAHAMQARDAGGVKGSPWGGAIERRRWLKAWTRRLPFRPLLRFLYSYVLQGGFLDGYAGYCLCVLMAWYEFISLAKLHEMRTVALLGTPPGVEEQRVLPSPITTPATKV
jgi:glycosyltransferase involved in cell wall biosynthesis